jgi:hypothetical protein
MAEPNPDATTGRHTRRACDRLSAVLTAIEAGGRVRWDAAAQRYQPCIPPAADRHARADVESVATLMTFLRQLAAADTAG